MKSKENNKGFGLLFFLVFLIIGLWPIINGDSPRIIFFIFALIFLILGLINSKLLTPLNKAWVKFGEILGKIIAPIVMAAVYFVSVAAIVAAFFGAQAYSGKTK